MIKFLMYLVPIAVSIGGIAWACYLFFGVLLPEKWQAPPEDSFLDDIHERISE